MAYITGSALMSHAVCPCRTQQCFAVKAGVDGFLDVTRANFCRVTEQVHELADRYRSQHNLPSMRVRPALRMSDLCLMGKRGGMTVSYFFSPVALLSSLTFPLHTYFCFYILHASEPSAHNSSQSLCALPQINYTAKRGFYLSLYSGQPLGKRRQQQQEQEQEEEDVPGPEPSTSMRTAGTGQPRATLPNAVAGGRIKIPPGPRQLAVASALQLQQQSLRVAVLARVA